MDIYDWKGIESYFESKRKLASKYVNGKRIKHEIEKDKKPIILKPYFRQNERY